MFRTPMPPGTLVDVPTAHGRGWFRAIVLTNWFPRGGTHWFTISALEADPAGFVEKGAVLDIMDDPLDNLPFRVISA